eukprot:PhF_6_TR26172/c0_g1_i1/m.37171
MDTKVGSGGKQNVLVSVCTNAKDSNVLTCRRDGVDFKSPPELIAHKFPVEEGFFPFDTVNSEPHVTTPAAVKIIQDAASGFTTGNRDSVVYVMGTRSSPKRRYGVSIATEIARKIMASPVAGSIYVANAWALTSKDEVRDFVDPSNINGVIADSIRDGTRVRQISKHKMRNVADADALGELVVRAMTERYGSDDFPTTTSSTSSTSDTHYCPDNVVITISQYSNQQKMDAGAESGAVHIVLLGDCERPRECGLEAQEADAFAATHRTLSAVLSVLSSIRYNRLRVPYAKSKLTLVLKRAYVADKSQLFTPTTKAPTMSYLVIHAVNKPQEAEETYHVLAAGKRVASIIGAGIGPASRDVAVDKWRLEIDTAIVHHKLLSACRQYGYGPKIYGVVDPQKDIAEEEEKHLKHIQQQRAEIRDRVILEMKKRCWDDTKRVLAESHSHRTLPPDRRQTLEAVVATFHNVKETLENNVTAGGNNIVQMERKIREAQDLTVKQQKDADALLSGSPRSVSKVTKELTALGDHDKELRDDMFTKLSKLYEGSVHAYVDACDQRGAYGMDDALYDSISEIDRKYVVDTAVPTAMSSQSLPDDLPAAYRNVLEYVQKEKDVLRVKQEAGAGGAPKRYAAAIAQATMKQRVSTDTLTQNLLAYTAHGTRLAKIPAKSGEVKVRHYYTFEEKGKPFFCACELNALGMMLDMRSPSFKLPVKDIVKIILGQHTEVWRAFVLSGSSNSPKVQPNADPSQGFRSNDRTDLTRLSANSSPTTYYRSFAIEMKSEKTLNVVCESDADYESWIVTFMQWKVPIAFGAELDPSYFATTSSTFQLDADDKQFCSQHHVLPAQLELLHKNVEKMGLKLASLTQMDIRVLSSLDWWRAGKYVETARRKR